MDHPKNWFGAGDVVKINLFPDKVGVILELLTSNQCIQNPPQVTPNGFPKTRPKNNGAVPIAGLDLASMAWSVPPATGELWHANVLTEFLRPAKNSPTIMHLLKIDEVVVKNRQRGLVRKWYRYHGTFTRCKYLGGGNSKMFYFHLENWERFPVWLICFNGVETTN